LVIRQLTYDTKDNLLNGNTAEKNSGPQLRGARRSEVRNMVCFLVAELEKLLSINLWR